MKKIVKALNWLLEKAKKVQEKKKQRDEKKFWAMVDAIYKSMPEIDNSLPGDCWSVYREAIDQKKMSHRKAFRKAENHGLERLIKAEERLGKSKPNNDDLKFYKKSITLLIAACIILIILLVVSTFSWVAAVRETQKNWENLTPTPIPTSAQPTLTPTSNSNSPTAKATPAPKAVKEAIKHLTDAKWPDGSYKIGDEVDPSKDKSTSGNAAFSKSNLKTPEDAIAFLKSGTVKAKTVMQDIKFRTGATEAQILDIRNWVAVQSEIQFFYPANTGFSNGKVKNFGSRDGDIGDIFLIFIPPIGIGFVALRGACANPQLVIPRPKNPADDPSQTGDAETGKNTGTNSGPGEYDAPETVPTSPVEKYTTPGAPSPDPTPTLAPDISPLPPPQSSAPDTNNPITGYAPPPGIIV